MKDELFAELVESVREAGAIMRGEQEPSRTFVVPGPDVKSIRDLPSKNPPNKNTNAPHKKAGALDHHKSRTFLMPRKKRLQSPSGTTTGPN